MRSAAICAVLALVGCRSSSVPPDPERPRAQVPPAPSGSSPTLASAAAQPSADAGPPRVEPEAPLAFGTRPPKDGPFYPVLDGMCIHAEVWPAGPATLLTYGNGTGAWTRGGGDPTMIRFTDDGVEDASALAPGEKAEKWRAIGPFGVYGAWPEPLVVYSDDQGSGRMRTYPSFWAHKENGWQRIAAWDEDDHYPDYPAAAVLDGTFLAFRSSIGGENSRPPDSIRSVAVSKDAHPPQVSALLRQGFRAKSLFRLDGAIVAAGGIESSTDAERSVLRALGDGKVKEIPIAGSVVRAVTGTHKAAFVVSPTYDTFRVLIWDGTNLTEGKTGTRGRRIIAMEFAPNDDLWISLDNGTLHTENAEGTKAQTLPEPIFGGDARTAHWPASGGVLAGVAQDDPWYVAKSGAVYHQAAGSWQKVTLPKPPFATGNGYLAQSIVVRSKDDVFINAGYAEKGLGWSTVERYRAILRSKRPKETLRCNEPEGGGTGGSGHGFMSFAPIADDTCKTPLVILLRLAYLRTYSGKPTYIYDRKTDYPSVRDETKKLASDLGPETELVEFEAGDQRYLAAKTPDVAAAKKLALAVAKRMPKYPEVRPEIVCGVPKADRTLVIDNATGKAKP